MKEWKDYYEILGVSPDANQEGIKKAYRDNAFIFHPDRMQGLSESVRKRAEGKMKKVIQAYEILGDPQKRQQYHSEWLQKKGGTVTARQGYQVPKPKPVVDPSVIRFTNVTPKTVRTKSFIIRNEGGPYSEINVSNPKTWVELVDYTSLSDSDQLPLEVRIKAEGKDWGKTYSEIIRVHLDSEEAQVKIQLRTKAKPVRKRTYVQQRTYAQQTVYTGSIPQAHVGPVPKSPPPRPQPAPPTPPTVPSRKIAVLGKWIVGLTVVFLLIYGLMSVWPRPEKEPKRSVKSASPLLIGKGIPQGKILFVSDRDGNKEIYSMDSAGLTTNLTYHPADDRNPAPSLDGKKIAFVSDRDGKNQDIYIMNNDGSHLVHVVVEKPLLLLEREKTEWERIMVGNPAWVSRIGIVFDYMKSTLSYSWILSSGPTLSLRKDTKETKIGFHMEVPSNYAYNKRVERNKYDYRKYTNPAVSPDRQQIACIRRIYRLLGLTSLYEISSEIIVKPLGWGAGEENSLARFEKRAVLTLTSQAWSPNGDKIVFSANSKIGIVEPKGRKFLWHTSPKVTWLDITGENPSWSPDGRWIAFDKEGEIYTLEIESGNIKRITENRFQDKNPVWVP